MIRSLMQSKTLQKPCVSTSACSSDFPCDLCQPGIERVWLKRAGSGDVSCNISLRRHRSSRTTTGGRTSMAATTCQRNLSRMGRHGVSRQSRCYGSFPRDHRCDSVLADQFTARCADLLPRCCATKGSHQAPSHSSPPSHMRPRSMPPLEILRATSDHQGYLLVGRRHSPALACPWLQPWQGAPALRP